MEALDPTLLYGGLALVSFVGIVVLLLSGRTPTRLFTGARGRLPRRFEVRDVTSGDIPPDAREPLDFLARKLGALGFEPADTPAGVPALQSLGHRVLLVPFVNREESTFFLMGIEAGFHPRTQLMLHILTPLAEERRVETTTLAALETLVRPPSVDAQVVLDAESVEELWSRHRRALLHHRREDRVAVQAADWRAFSAAAYESWVQAGVRSQRLTLEKNGETYRVRARPKSMI